MPQGLQVFGPTGVLWVDITSRLARFYGSITLGPNNDTKPVNGLNGQGVPFAYAPNVTEQVRTHAASGTQFRAPTTSNLVFSGSTNIEAQFAFTNFDNPFIFVYYGAY